MHDRSESVDGAVSRDSLGPAAPIPKILDRATTTPAAVASAGEERTGGTAFAESSKLLERARHTGAGGAESRACGRHSIGWHAPKGAVAVSAGRRNSPGRTPLRTIMLVPPQDVSDPKSPRSIRAAAESSDDAGTRTPTSEMSMIGMPHDESPRASFRDDLAGAANFPGRPARKAVSS